MAPKIAMLRCRVEVNWVALKFAIQMRLYWNCCENNLFSVHLVRSIHTVHLEAYGRMFSVFGHPFDCCRRCCLATIFPWDQQVPDYLNIYSVFPPNSERHGKWQQHRSLSFKKKNLNFMLSRDRKQDHLRERILPSHKSERIVGNNFLLVAAGL